MFGDRVVTGPGHCSALSVSTSPSVSPIRPASTPLPVCVCVFVFVCVCETLRSLGGQTKKLRPLKQLSPFHCVSCFGVVEETESEVRDVFHFKLQS